MEARLFGFWFVLPLIVLAEAVVAHYIWKGGRDGPADRVSPGLLSGLAQKRPGIALIFAFWLGLTAVAWLYEFVFGQFLLYLVIFGGGRVAGGVGMVVFALVMGSPPIACAQVILRFCQPAVRPTLRLPLLRG